MPEIKKESLFSKLANVQEKLKAPKDKDNSFGKYKYRSLEDILEKAKPLLNENGLILILNDEIVEISGRFYVKATATVLNADDSDNAGISAIAFARESESKSGMDAAQLTGSCSSYARKYAVSGLFCIDNNKDIDSDEYAAEPTPEKAKTTAAKTAGRPKKTAEPAPEPTPTPTPEPPPIIEPVYCEDCGAEIKPVKTPKGEYNVAAIIAGTQKSFGVNCCFNCGSLRAKRAKAEKAATENNGG